MHNMRWWIAYHCKNDDGDGQKIRFQAKSHREAMNVAIAHYRTHKIVIELE